MCHRVSSHPEKRESQNMKRSLQKEYLPLKVIEAERRKPFVLAYREEFEGGDFDKILSEADKSRIFYCLLDKVELSDLPNFTKSMGEKYSNEVERETMLFYLKRLGFLEEIFPLYNKARVVRAAKEGHNDVNKS
jgi:hypothetical protein